MTLSSDTVTRIVLLVCEGSWRGSQNSEVVKTSFAVFSDILCTIGKKTWSGQRVNLDMVP